MTAVETNELRAGLAQALAETSGRERDVVSLRRSPHPYRTSFALERLDVELSDDSRLALLFKDLGWGSLNPESREAKPDFLHDPTREIEVYRQLLAPTGFGPPRYYGSVADPERERFWLFIELVDGVELFQVGDIDRWKRAARWLAAMHARFEPRVENAAAAVPLIAFDAGYCERWVERAREFASPESSERRAEVDRLASLCDSLHGELLSLPRTVIHGEFYPSNVLVSTGGRVCAVDWELAAIAPGLLDLAALTTGWDGDDRVALEDAYAEAWTELGGDRERVAGLGEDLDRCRLHMAIRWLGWAPAWKAPAEHRHDWLAEASRAAGRLGL